MTSSPPIFCAIDTSDLDQAQSLSRKISGTGCGIKLGLEFFNRFGPSGVEKIKKKIGDSKLFLDLKYHDIPNTVAGAIKAVSTLGVDYLNVHAAGGLEMMQEAKAVCPPQTKLLAVTVLTSLEDEHLRAVGQSTPAGDQVERLARLTQTAGLDGVVCSAHEIKRLRAACGDDFVLMVPGIRPAGADKGDQKRVMTPSEAFEAGATHLVIGRPITGAPDPETAARDILKALR
ncbi:MAG: orotidine-5'-phosphate decarboxylase [Alphaproteobacteria bacterium]|nr:orotidine-5'-phosphate decarboxylase [Alphaproteobacteria bacterium]